MKTHNHQIRAEDASRSIKDLVFNQWRNTASSSSSSSSCESRTDTTKLLNLIDFYLPYFPLERIHIVTLFERLLQARAQHAKGPLGLSWDPRLPGFLADKVDYEGGLPIEGAKEVRAVMTRYVSSALRAWEREHLHGEDVHGTLHLSPPRSPLHTELQVKLLVGKKQ